MDRREAIKKLGLGAAAVVGAGSVVPAATANETTEKININESTEKIDSPTKPTVIGYDEIRHYHQIRVMDVNHKTDEFLHFFMRSESSNIKDAWENEGEYPITFRIDKCKADTSTLIAKPLVEIFNEMHAIELPSTPEQDRRKLFEMERLRNRIAKDSLRGRANILFYGDNGMLLSNGIPEMQTIEHLPGLNGYVLAYAGNIIYDQPLIGFKNVKGCSELVFLKNPDFDKWVRRFQFV